MIKVSEKSTFFIKVANFVFFFLFKAHLL